MNNIQIFKNQKFGEIRAVEYNDEPWLVGKDVTEKLGYRNGSRDINRHVDKEDRIVTSLHDGIQNREMTIINESGFYALVLGSEMKQAKKFKKWVTKEVLPSIRKHGAYLTDNVMDNILNNPDFGIKLLNELKAEREEKERLKMTATRQQQIIGELKPKADYTDTILKNKGLVTITQIAKDYGMSGQAMNKILYDLEIQYKQSGQWLLYREHQGKGYTHSATVEITRNNGMHDIKMNTKWTQKGRLFLYKVLKENDILPDIEKITS